MKRIKVTLSSDEVERVIIECAKAPLYMRKDWNAEISSRDSYGDWTVTFTEPPPEAPKPA